MLRLRVEESEPLLLAGDALWSLKDDGVSICGFVGRISALCKVPVSCISARLLQTDGCADFSFASS